LKAVNSGSLVKLRKDFQKANPKIITPSIKYEQTQTQMSAAVPPKNVHKITEALNSTTESDFRRSCLMESPFLMFGHSFGNDLSSGEDDGEGLTAEELKEARAQLEAMTIKNSREDFRASLRKNFETLCDRVCQNAFC